MAVLDLASSGGYLHFDRGQCVAAGAARAEAYRSAHPFPHIAIDDFLDADMLRALVAEFPGHGDRPYFDRAQERLKYQYDPNTVDSGRVRNLLAELNGEPFLAFLEAMTGIKGLIPDPYFSGGGLHETMRGGHLSVHADFNIHGQMQLERRLNLLVYLNDDWAPDYGGDLELWDKGMTRAEVSIAPVMARAVVFDTSLKSFHGVPDALTCPPDRSRRSIATYYYTAVRADASLPVRTTTFQPRPGSGDRRDWRVGYFHFVEDWVPARLKRHAMRLLR